MGDLLAKFLPLRECGHSSLKEYEVFHFAYYLLEWRAPQQKLYSSQRLIFFNETNRELRRILPRKTAHPPRTFMKKEYVITDFY